MFKLSQVRLALLDVLIYHQCSLPRGPFENGFHFIVGPIALILGRGALWNAHLKRAIRD